MHTFFQAMLLSFGKNRLDNIKPPFRELCFFAGFVAKLEYTYPINANHNDEVVVS